MHGISSIIYIILVACLLPYAFTVIAKFTGGFQPVDNQNPRDFLANTKGIAARANAVQQNSFESLPLFLTAILMAEYMVVPEYFILRLGWAYIILRVIYGIFYLSNWATLHFILGFF